MRGAWRMPGHEHWSRQVLRGILAGGLWGGLIGAIVLALSSQLADWRDLTPAVTKAQSEETVASPEVADVLLEPPVVTAGVRADPPASTDIPAQATGVAGETAAPTLETDAPGAPLAAQPPSPAIVDVPDDQLPTSPAGTTGTAPDAVDVASVGAPAADSLPTMTATETAPSPARFGPSATDDVAELTLDAGDDGTPAAPEAGGATPTVSRDRSTAPALGTDLAPDAPSAPASTPSAVASAGEAPSAPTAADRGGIDVVSDDAPSVGNAPGAANPAPDAVDIVTVAPTVQSDAPGALVTEADEASPVVESQDAAPVIAEAPSAAEAPVVETAAPEADAAPSEPEPQQVAEPEPQPDTATEEPLVVAQADTGSRTEPRIIRGVGEEASEGAVRVRRLPTVGDDADVEEVVEDATPEEVSPEPVEAAEAVEEVPALEANAIAFETPDAALVSIVLVHGAASAAPTETTVPLTFAVPAWLPGAADVAADYRTAGHEVVLIPDLPPNPTAQDVEVALSVTLEEFPFAVGLIDPDGAGFQASRDATAQVVATAARTGHGVLSASRGFNSAARLAARDGVAAATVERSIAPEVEDQSEIGRVLDQVAFRARNDGVAVIVGEASEAHLSGVLAWAQDNADDGLAIAPVSAILKASTQE